jgi:hypothetical protein
VPQSTNRLLAVIITIIYPKLLRKAIQCHRDIRSLRTAVRNPGNCNDSGFKKFTMVSFFFSYNRSFPLIHLTDFFHSFLSRFLEDNLFYSSHLAVERRTDKKMTSNSISTSNALIRVADTGAAKGEAMFKRDVFLS